METTWQYENRECAATWAHVKFRVKRQVGEVESRDITMSMKRDLH
jgi:hypothetical protein